MTPADRLDPDQVPCPRCGMGPGQVCRQPDGNRARAIHAARRRAADAPPANPTQTRHGGKRFDSASASAAARRSAQERRRRAAENAAAVEAARAQAEADALEAEAQQLAADATRYARDRAILRRKVLDAAQLATTRLVESLEGLERAQVDDDGRVVRTAVERPDRNGVPRQIEVPDMRGWASADTVERLARSASLTLNSLRLEEGKPTGIERHEGTGGTAATLGEAGVSELIAWAAGNLRDKGPS